MDDSKPGFIHPTPPEKEPISREDYDRLELFRHAVLQRSRLVDCHHVKDQHLLREIDERKSANDRLDAEIDLHHTLRAAASVLLGSDATATTADLCTELSRYKEEEVALRDRYVRLRTAVCQLLAQPPSVDMGTLISGIAEMARDQVLPLDDVDDANSLQLLNSELEAEVHFLNDRLVHAVRAVQHMTAIALDVASERGGSGCSHD